MYVYFVKPPGPGGSGAVLGSLEQRDPEYERKLERAGVDWDVLPDVDPNDAPKADQLQRAAVREVTRTDRQGRETRVKVVQLDREGVTH